ncbi:MAG TPA: hypothetical protein VGF86_03325 [Candidatus Tumulicola sp.]|jgi:hypothetical protein
MSDVRQQRNLKIPAIPAYEALREILRAIEVQEGSWRGFALHVSLGDLHLADFGYVAVPVCVVVGREHEAARAVDLTFNAANQASSFPTFKGSIGVDAMGTSGSILWLGGGYDVPLQIFGKIIDNTLAGGIAKRTLENFIDDIAAACTAFVERREAEYVRYRMFER